MSTTVNAGVPQIRWNDKETVPGFIDGTITIPIQKDLKGDDLGALNAGLLAIGKEIGKRYGVSEWRLIRDYVKSIFNYKP